MRDYVVGHVAGLRLSVRPSALIALPALWCMFTFAAAKRLHLSLRAASRPALAAVLGHICSSIWHHLGHALAARRTGYPMIGISSSGVLATSVYPADEPPLPASLHIRRALGGPLASGVLTLILWSTIHTVRPKGATTRWALWLLLLNNLLVNTLQVFIPAGFNDGQTVWRWLPELRGSVRPPTADRPARRFVLL